VLLQITPNIEQIDNGENKHKLPRTNEDLISVFGNGAYRIKIVDLGNACWTYLHFTDDVQTRQYRAPEVIIGSGYDTSIDIWSMGCIVFELLTGDLLFEPKSGKNFSKSDDHIAQMFELLGEIPTNIALCGKKSHKYFKRNGELLHINKLKFWNLKDVLKDKYKYEEPEIQIINDFIFPMLNFNPSARSTATTCINHPWIRDIDLNDFLSVFTPVNYNL